MSNVQRALRTRPGQRGRCLSSDVVTILSTVDAYRELAAVPSGPNRV